MGGVVSEGERGGGGCRLMQITSSVLAVLPCGGHMQLCPFLGNCLVTNEHVPMSVNLLIVEQILCFPPGVKTNEQSTTSPMRVYGAAGSVLSMTPRRRVKLVV